MTISTKEVIGEEENHMIWVRKHGLSGTNKRKTQTKKTNRLLTSTR